MAKNIKTICFDLDNTLCRTFKNYYHESKPIKKNIRLVNELFREGYNIKIFTSRFMGRSNENQLKAKKKGFKLTIQQLKKWNIKYHKLIMGKPSYDLIIDDKAFGYGIEWPSKLKKILKGKS
ncbi:phosphoheptose isomerase [Candidatus Pelagibacter sp.]|nr:phosphoheptose isomerase [Candidatus Pelagibacter sp.]